MPMSTAEVQGFTASYTREAINNKGETITIGCQDIRAAYVAVDQWVEDNAAAFNAALPTAFKTAASSDQKSRLLRHVLYKKYENT